LIKDKRFKHKHKTVQAPERKNGKREKSGGKEGGGQEIVLSTAKGCRRGCQSD